VGSYTIEFWSVDNEGNVETPHNTASFTVTPPDTTAPVTTSNAVGSYVGSANITLTAVDNPGGSGVATTWFRVNGGAQTPGTTIPTISTPGDYTIEFWSVDNAGNIELPHKTASFTVTPIVSGTGTIQFAWSWATEDSWAEYYVHDSGGNLVASGSGDYWSGWDGWFYVTVPVSAQPYSLSILWYDPQYDDEEHWTYGSALIDEPGEIYTMPY
jgi:hypothetical protein